MTFIENRLTDYQYNADNRIENKLFNKLLFDTIFTLNSLKIYIFLEHMRERSLLLIGPLDNYQPIANNLRMTKLIILVDILYYQN